METICGQVRGNTVHDLSLGTDWVTQKVLEKTARPARSRKVCSLERP
jgi:hypothetical protein